MRLKEEQQKQLQQSTLSSSMDAFSTGDTLSEGKGSSVADNTTAESDNIEQGVNLTSDISYQQTGSVQESEINDCVPFPVADDDDAPSDCREPSSAVLEECRNSDTIEQTKTMDKKDM